MSVAESVELALRSDGSRLIAALARRYRDIERAQEAVQEAALRALETWPTRGIPSDPAAWLFVVARRALVDMLRTEPVEAGNPEQVAPETPADSRLELLFACCHPAIEPRNQVGLALWTLGGLSVDEVARAFLEKPSATSRRLTRASQKIRDAGIPFEVPGPGQFRARLAGSLAAIYLLFNEGYASTQEGGGMRASVCRQALHLGAAVVQLLPDEPEVLGLQALMTLHHARRAGRFDDEGLMVTLENQDRSLWNAGEIADGVAQLERALSLHSPGPYQIQAAIAAIHVESPSSDATDWSQITALYGALLQHNPSPVVELNAAVALAMSAGPERGLAWMDELIERQVLVGYPLLFACRADLLRRLGRTVEARAAYDEAIAHTKNPQEATFLRSRRDGASRRRRRRRVLTQVAPRPLADRDWRRVKTLFRSPPRRGRPRRPDREVLEAVLWVLTSGVPWRECPERFGPWQTIYHRFRTWENDGRMAAVYARLAHHPAARAGRVLLPGRPSRLRE